MVLRHPAEALFPSTENYVSINIIHNAICKNMYKIKHNNQKKYFSVKNILER